MRQLALWIFAFALVACAPPHVAPSDDARAVGAALTGPVQVTNASSTCPAGAAAGSICATVSVTACGLPSLGAQLVRTNPTGVTGQTGRATYLAPYFAGGAGTILSTAYQQIVPALNAAGVATWQVVWQQVGSPGGWEVTPQHSIEAGACRIDALGAWMRQVSPPTVALCAQGYSGGSSGLAYALAYYNASRWMDVAQLMSGPPMARLDLGCASPPYASAAVCGVTYSLGLEPQHAQAIDAWLGTTGCATAPSDPNKLAAESILTGPGPVLGYPYTKINLATCAQQSAAAGMSALYEQALTAAGTSVTRTCVAGGCQGENVLADQAGRDAVVAAFLAFCH